MNNLLESSINDPATLKSFIKYEVLQKKPVYEAYKSFCKIMGSEVMNFPDFEYWYMRFYNGQVDVNYDRSQDPEPLNFENLPVGIVERVIKELNPLDRIMTRHASKSLRNCVDRQKVHIDNLKLIISDDAWTFMGFSPDNRILKYESIINGFSISSGKQTVEIKKSCFISTALQDFKDWSIENFEVTDVCENHELFKLRWMFFPNEYKGTLQIKNFKCSSVENLRAFVELIKPGTLETIDAHAKSWCDVYNMEQWKNAKTISIHGDPQVFGWAIVCCLHSNFFDVTVEQPQAYQLNEMKNDILKRPNFQKCVIRTKETIKSCIVDAGFGEKIFEEGREKIFLPIPGSMDRLKITHQRYQLIIEKIRGV